MAKAKKLEETPEVSGAPRERIVIFYRNSLLSKSYGVGVALNHHETFSAGQIIRDEEKIKEILENNLPVEIYERVD